MPDLVQRAVESLRRAGVVLTDGLTDREVTRVEDRLGFTFGPEHRLLVQTALPAGPRWPDWRAGAEDDLRRRLDWPAEGLLFDVRHDAFWPASWGARPQQLDQREAEARRRIGELPRLVPVYSHRYMTSDPRFEPSPVFSVHQSDVIYYGENLVDYVSREFGLRHAQPLQPPQPPQVRVSFWSELAEGAEDSGL